MFLWHPKMWGISWWNEVLNTIVRFIETLIVAENLCYSECLESKNDKNNNLPLPLPSWSSLPEKFCLLTGRREVETENVYYFN